MTPLSFNLQRIIAKIQSGKVSNPAYLEIFRRRIKNEQRLPIRLAEGFSAWRTLNSARDRKNARVTPEIERCAEAYIEEIQQIPQLDRKERKAYHRASIATEDFLEKNPDWKLDWERDWEFTLSRLTILALMHMRMELQCQRIDRVTLRKIVKDYCAKKDLSAKSENFWRRLLHDDSDISWLLSDSARE